MRARDDVNAYQLANTTGSSGSGVRGSFDGGNIATNDSGHKARADFFVADQHDIRRLDHCVCGFNRGDQAFRFNHSKCFH